DIGVIYCLYLFFFFFQAEDGIRDRTVTGVQTCALPISMLLGRPVKICLNREEVFYMHRGRHPVLMKMRTGVTRDGKLTGMHVQRSEERRVGKECRSRG